MTKYHYSEWQISDYVKVLKRLDMVTNYQHDLILLTNIEQRFSAYKNQNNPRGKVTSNLSNEVTT
jgi:hypothetical protein